MDSLKRRGVKMKMTSVALILYRGLRLTLSVNGKEENLRGVPKGSYVYMQHIPES